MSEQEFLDQHSALVYNLALRLTGNRADAEDLAQDALIKALKSLDGFRGDSRASTWVYRITVNAWKNRVRSEKRRAFWRTVSFGLLGGEDEDGPAAEPAAPEAPLDAALETDETSRAVKAALLELDDEERAIVVLRELEDKSYEEIGETLGLPQGTVKSRLFRARAKLRARLSKGSMTP